MGMFFCCRRSRLFEQRPENLQGLGGGEEKEERKRENKIDIKQQKKDDKIKRKRGTKSTKYLQCSQRRHLKMLICIFASYFWL